MFEHYNYFKNYETRDTRFYLALQGLSKGNMSQGLYDAFRNYVPKELPYNLENALRAYNFAIIDLGLYLDTHPEDHSFRSQTDNNQNTLYTLILQLTNNQPRMNSLVQATALVPCNVVFLL